MLTTVAERNGRLKAQLENTPQPMPRSSATSSMNRTIYRAGHTGSGTFRATTTPTRTPTPPALHPLTPITILLKTFSVWVFFTRSFPQFLRILVSAPGTENTTSKHTQSNKESCSQRVKVHALVSGSIRLLCP